MTVTLPINLMLAFKLGRSIQLETEMCSHAALNVLWFHSHPKVWTQCEEQLGWHPLCCSVVVILQRLQTVMRLRDTSSVWCECNDCTDSHITCYIKWLMPHPVCIVYLYRHHNIHNPCCHHMIWISQSSQTVVLHLKPKDLIQPRAAFVF